MGFGHQIWTFESVKDNNYVKLEDTNNILKLRPRGFLKALQFPIIILASQDFDNQSPSASPMVVIFRQFKYTHREKATSNKTLALTKGMNMDIWVVGKSNQRLLN